jgi:hypothetical protein
MTSVKPQLSAYAVTAVTGAAVIAKAQAGALEWDRIGHMTELPRLQEGAVAAAWMVRETGQKEGVDTVNNFGFGLGRTSAGLARIPYVFQSSQYLQGLESGSSPTSGTRFPLGWGPFKDL